MKRPVLEHLVHRVRPAARIGCALLSAALGLAACTPCRTAVDCAAGQACTSGSCLAANVCTPGAAAACNCPGGAEGTQVCNAAATGFEACKCGTAACTEATCVTVPSLVGKDLDAAGALVAAAGLKLPDPIDPLGFVVERRVADPPVSILEQSPAAGTLAPPGTSLVLRVTLPPDEPSPGQPHAHFLRGALVQDTEASAQEYYSAIDPPAISSRTTLADWRAANGFGQPADAESSATYVNHTDLGFGRHMHMRRAGKRVAFYVDNYPTVEDAIAGTRLIATVAMEWSPRENGSNPSDYFTKFFVFNRRGARITDPILDDFGPKQQPALCLACHGGAISDLTYSNGGDVGAHFIPFDLDSLAYSTRKNYTRADQEAAFKKLNEAVKATYTAADTSVVPELVDGWYGGPTHPKAAFDGTYTQAGWQSSAAAVALYQAVYARSCRSCHAQREALMDFSSYAQFTGEAGLIRARIFEDGEMPLSQRGFLNFWLSFPSQPKLLAAEVGQIPFHGPGRPVARIALVTSGVLRPGQTITLDGSSSAFADTFLWSQVGGPAVSLRPAGGQVTFTTPAAPAPAATFTIQLIAAVGTLQSTPITLAVSSVDPPGLPTSVTAIARIGGAQVSWNTPGNNGNATITGYRVLPRSTTPGGAEPVGTASDTTALVSGLTPNKSYTFTVVAQNAAGLSSAASAASAPILVPNVNPGSPTAPLNPMAIPGPASATVSWSPPVDQGGSPITSYLITVTRGGAFVATVATASSPRTIGPAPAPLPNVALVTCNYQPGSPATQTCGSSSQYQYSFTVAATNSFGTGLTATTAPMTPKVSYTEDGVVKIWTQAVLPGPAGSNRCTSCHAGGQPPNLSGADTTTFTNAKAEGNFIFDYPTGGVVGIITPRMCTTGSMSTICFSTSSAEAMTIAQWLLDGSLF